MNPRAHAHAIGLVFSVEQARKIGLHEYMIYRFNHNSLSAKALIPAPVFRMDKTPPTAASVAFSGKDVGVGRMQCEERNDTRFKREQVDTFPVIDSHRRLQSSRCVKRKDVRYHTQGAWASFASCHNRDRVCAPTLPPLHSIELAPARAVATSFLRPIRDQR